MGSAQAKKSLGFTLLLVIIVTDQANTRVLAELITMITNCHTRSLGPGYIVGFRRVKVPSVRLILYSTT